MADEEIDIKGPPLRPSKPNPMASRVKKTRRSPRNPGSGTSASPPSETIPKITLRPGTPIPPQPSSSASNPFVPNNSPADDLSGSTLRDIQRVPSFTLPRIVETPYIQDLTIAELPHVPPDTPTVNLCPFIAAHLQPADYMIPYYPLQLPNTRYIFRLLYVLKEDMEAPTVSGNFYQYTAVFLMTGIPHNIPAIIGTRIDESFIAAVQRNVHRERARIHESYVNFLMNRPSGL